MSVGPRSSLAGAKKGERPLKGDSSQKSLVGRERELLELDAVDKAIDDSIRAGEAAYQDHMYDRAGSDWRAALGMMSSSDANPARRAKVLHYLGDELLSSAPEAIAYLGAALPLLESLNQTTDVADTHSRLGLFLSGPHLGCLDVPRAMDHFEKAEALLTRQADQAKLIRLYHHKGSACQLSMETPKGLELTRRAMELSEQLGDEFWWIQAAMINTRFLIALGRLAEAHSLELRAQEKAERFADAYSGSIVAWLGGVNCSDLWDPRAALPKYLAELSRPRTSRSPTRSLPLLTESSHMYVQVGEMAEARRVLAQMRGPTASTALPWEDGDWDRTHLDVTERIELARRGGNLDSICLRTHWLGMICRIRGRYAESEAFSKESLEISRNAPNLTRVLWAEQDLCLLYFDMRRREDAHRSLAHCRNILALGEDWRGIEGGVTRAQAVVAALDLKFNDADAQFQKALDIFRRYSEPWMEADTYRYWGCALISAGDKRRASEKLGAAIEIYRRIGAGQRWIDRVEETRAKISIPAAPSVPNPSVPTACSFQREGDFWTISYRNHTLRLKNMKGLRYIAHLLAHPGEQFHVHDLVTAIDRAAQAGETSPRDFFELRVANDLGDAGAVLDPRAKAEYRSRRVELRGELAEAEEANDGGRAGLIREELEMLEEQLAAAVGLGGRDRKAADHAERTRSRVGRAIRGSLKSIRENDASLGHHLTTCIRTGYFCAYHPDPDVSLVWRL